MRYIPPANSVIAWQPRFTAPGIAQACATEVILYFDANPTIKQCSLSVNDASGYSEDEILTTGFNSIGLRNASDLYFAFANAVIAEVNGRRPDLADRTYACLAYRETYDPPSFPISPQLIPFVCDERYVWVDPAQRAAGVVHLESWAAVSARTGLYDYAYGSRYCVPRMYQGVLSDIVRTAAANHAKAGFLEWGITFGEGPKAQTMLKLMWDPNTDVAAADSAWYAGVAGPGAARLTDFYGVWERVWTEQVPQTAWFRGSADLTYSRFENGTYLEAVSDADMAQARSHLNAAIAAAPTAAQ